MATRRKRRVALVAVLWLLALGLFAAMWILYDNTRLSHRAAPGTGHFPYMPFYGAMVWWFFLVIPLIGWTWGYFNDLKSKGLDARYDRYLNNGERYSEDASP